MRPAVLTALRSAGGLPGLLAVGLLPVPAGDAAELLAVVLPAGTASSSSLGR